MQVYIGIDWSENKHDVVFMNEAGADLACLVIAHTPEGFAQLDARRRKLGLAVEDCQIGMETAHSILIDYLWSQDYTQLYVLPPNQVKSNQGRFRQSGAKDDSADARLIADILRTDRRHSQPWKPDTLLTRQIRSQVSLIIHLNRHILRLSNRLRAILLRYYPAALHIFSAGLRTQILPEFICAYPTPQAAQRLTFAEFEAFARHHHYPALGRLPACFANLQADYPAASPEVVLTYQSEAMMLAEMLLLATRDKTLCLRQLLQLFSQHPRHATFASLPGAGDFIGPALLAKFGDDPLRLPSAASSQSLAGTAPVTRRSGKRKTVSYRWACDKEWRFIAQEWAIALVHQSHSPIAAAYFQTIRPHCHSDAHAYRCVANRWMAVAWKLWQTGQTYDEAYHFQQRTLRSKPR